MVLSGYMLQWSGFDSTVDVQPESVITNMRLLYMLVPMGFVSLAACLLLFYPLSEARVRATQAELEQRKKRLEAQ
jgi:Na+/melibiose symporter-like transporter